MGRKYNNRIEVFHDMKDEGLSYFITGFTRSDAMPDEESRLAFARCEEALEAFEDLIESSYFGLSSNVKISNP